MKKQIRSVWLMIAVLLGSLFTVPLQAETTSIADDPRVLFLSSYNYDWESVPKQLDGITSVLDGHASVEYVFMDTKHEEYETVKPRVYEEIKAHEDSDGAYDYIITADDAALQFVLEYRSELFDGVPVVFEGVNNEEFAATAAEDPRITGVVETFPLEDTLETAIKIQPDATRVVGISDDTLSGAGSTDQFMDCQDSFPDLSFEVLDTSTMTIEQLQQTLSSYGNDTILVFLMMTTDTTGKHYSGTEAVEFICANTSIPVYKADELGMGNGILGGVMVSYSEMAAEAARIVLDVDRGTPIKTYQVEKAATYPCFDRDVMKQYSISTSAVPEGSTFINEKVSFFDQYKKIILPSAVMFGVMAFGIMLSIMGNRRLKKALKLQSRAKDLAWQAEDSMRQQKQELSDILNHIATGILVYSFHEDHFEISAANDAVCRMMGIDRDKTIGTKDDAALQLIHPSDMPVVLKAIEQLKMPGGSVDFHYRSRNLTSGKYLWVSGRGRSIGQEDGTVTAYVSSADITKQRQAEKLQRELDAAQKENEIKADFYSRMSHDMRTPMNGILGIADLASEEQDINQLHQDLGKIKQSGEYMLSLINDTLDLQRIETGRMKLEPEIVCERDLFNEMEAMIDPLMKEKQIHFKVDTTSTELDRYVNVDPVRSKQIVVNLLSNAAKYTPAGGTVVLSLSESGRTKKISHEVLKITDNGVGMSESFLKHGIFKPFTQERNVYSMDYAGSGLGLSIVKRLVQLMHGKIEVQSELGKGSCFTIYMDIELVPQETVNLQKDQAAEKHQQYLNCLNGRVVLLCEDQPLNAEIAMRILQKAGADVVWAKDGAEGVKRFMDSAANEFDAILMDIRMPNMDGLEAAKMIRASSHPHAQDIAIIAMSANAYPEDIQKSLDAGMDGHLAKPVIPERLYETLLNAWGTAEKSLNNQSRN